MEPVRSLLTVCCPTRFRSSVTLMLPCRLQTSVWWLSHCVHQTSKQMVSDTDIRHSADSKCFGLLHRSFVSAFSLFSWNFISSRGRKKKPLKCSVVVWQQAKQQQGSTTLNILDASSFESKGTLAERQTLFKTSTIGCGGKAPD